MQRYEVFQGGQAVGTVEVTCKGLYLIFDCQCNIGGEVMYDLIIKSGAVCNNIGLLMPGQHGYSLHKQIPVKLVGKGPFLFSLQPRHQKMKGLIVPICEGSPFAYLSQLEQAFLIKNREAVSLAFPDENNAKNREIKA